MQFFLTGPAGYGIAYRRMAKAKGWKLDQYGLWNQHGELIASRTEHDIYKALGKEYKEPQERGQ
jgi:DNA polymerase (family X)